MAAKEQDKGRYWALVVYPSKEELEEKNPDCKYDGSQGYGSAPNNWIQLLQDQGLPVAISPLHDQDIEPDGSVKKPHYHVIVCYANNTTFNAVVKTYTSPLNAPIPKCLASVRGMYRYHCHLDNPEKYQYPDDQRVFLNGFDIAEYVELTRAEETEIIERIRGYIIDNHIYEYCDLVDMLASEGMMQEYAYSVRSTFLWNTYLKSRHYKKMNQENQ